MGSAGDDRRHSFSVVMLPWLAHGHVFPFLEFAKRLSHHNIEVHFCSSPLILASVASELDTKSFPSIHLVELHLPTLPGLSPDLHTTKHLPKHLMPSLKQAFDMVAPSFNRLLETLRPDLVIYDFIQPWAPAVAHRRGIPSIDFVPCGCASSAFFTHYLMRPDEIFPFPALVLGNGQEDSAHAASVCDDGRFMKCMVRSSGLVAIKTLRAIEGEYVDYFSGLLGKEVVPIGPLVPADEKESTTNEDERRSEAQVMEWLREKGRSSVVFVSFGSEYFMSKPEIEELAYGLELSGVSFIWVVRFPRDEGSCTEDRISSHLPDGFLKRTSTLGRGLIVEGWAPQRKILAHPNVRGFVTHCGWSSVVEALYYGVPMIALPQHLDQPMNAKLVVELGVGIEIKNERRSGEGARGEAAGFKRGEVGKVIRDVVVNGEGDDVRRKVKEMAEVVRRSGKEEMQVFVEKITRLCKSRECSDDGFESTRD